MRCCSFSCCSLVLLIVCCVVFVCLLNVERAAIDAVFKSMPSRPQDLIAAFSLLFFLLLVVFLVFIHLFSCAGCFVVRSFSRSVVTKIGCGGFANVRHWNHLRRSVSFVFVCCCVDSFVWFCLFAQSLRTTSKPLNCPTRFVFACFLLRGFGFLLCFHCVVFLFVLCCRPWRTCWTRAVSISNSHTKIHWICLTMTMLDERYLIFIVLSIALKKRLSNDCSVASWTSEGGAGKAKKIQINRIFELTRQIVWLSVVRVTRTEEKWQNTCSLVSSNQGLKQAHCVWGIDVMQGRLIATLSSVRFSVCVRHGRRQPTRQRDIECHHL